MTLVMYLMTQCQWQRRYAVFVKWHTVTFAASQGSGNACPPRLVRPSFVFLFNAVLYGLPETQLVQNSAARLITGTPRRDHITAVLFNLYWLPVRQRIDFKLLVFGYRAGHSLGPLHLSSLVTPYIPTRTLRSDNQDISTVSSRAVWSLGLFRGRADTVKRPTSRNHSVEA